MELDSRPAHQPDIERPEEGELRLAAGGARRYLGGDELEVAADLQRGSGTGEDQRPHLTPAHRDLGDERQFQVGQLDVEETVVGLCAPAFEGKEQLGPEAEGTRDGVSRKTPVTEPCLLSSCCASGPTRSLRL